ncbi:MAG: amidase [Gemmataceae bacterium]
MPPTLLEAAAALRSRRLSCVDLLNQCLERIDRFEVQVRAWVLVDRDGARQTAAERDRELDRGIDRGPLHGIPVGVKDIFDVFDWPTACGSRLWQHSYARHDAPAVARLRQAGAVLVGKTVTTAYASFDPPVTRNPWHLDRTPGGSSSGSAAAVATGMCLAALASQTGGSITRPASYCGVPACKPTYGLVDASGGAAAGGVDGPRRCDGADGGRRGGDDAGDRRRGVSGAAAGAARPSAGAGAIARAVRPVGR